MYEFFSLNVITDSSEMEEFKFEPEANAMVSNYIQHVHERHENKPPLHETLAIFHVKNPALKLTAREI